ncbi:hypothetical protein BJX68DRAFT_259872 [Aspergillus pseudodeflectus]|uniref:Uncharacterized protein n=1 Tax=Aspergillus pseudodeflectus TaxID=176178 RepID=A0ABR4JAK6_9EURO
MSRPGLFSSRAHFPSCSDQAPSRIASRRVPSLSLGLPGTLEMPPLLNSSAVASETHDRSSFSASPGASLARPTNARREEVPQIRMTDTTAVRIPSGERANMRLSRRLVDSERYCLVRRSPKRATRGA